MFFAALTVLASAGLFAAGCDEYDDVPPRSSGGSYDLLPIVGESASPRSSKRGGRFVRSTNRRSEIDTLIVSLNKDGL